MNEVDLAILAAPSAIEITDPIRLFDRWLKAAEATEPNDANAMTVSTVAADGRPSARILLLKGHDERGFVFYTNTQSRKGQELTATRVASLCFHWKSLRRQVRVVGKVEPVSEAEADAYFASRSRNSRVGAWASEQSRPLPEPDALKTRIAEMEARFGDGEVPRPAHWSGFRVIPDEIEFWQERLYRLHDRLVFRADPTEGGDPERQTVKGWRTERLYP